jgi:glycosyltransferase involved in cell wall biosynthesis
MTLTILCTISFVTAAIPGVLFCWNLFLYREPPVASTGENASGTTNPISVLIPARNEEASIATAVESVLRSTGVEVEVVVLDDSSTDRTAAIVCEIAARDARVRLERAPSLPPGWNGKQHACFVLARLARHDLFCFLDADVRLAPEALARMAAFLTISHSDLVSGFPFQETESALEWLFLPLIHFVLLGFLPMAAMRKSSAPGFAAGCGQFIMVRREGYRVSGGHSQIRSTMHDGLLLPRLFREHGLRTDLADLTRLATCRMYHNAAEVWNGLAKNATEGLAAPARIFPFSFFLFFGQVLPLVLLVFVVGYAGLHSMAGILALGATTACFVPRLLAVLRFRQRLLSAILHPIGVLLLLVLEWYALGRKLAGKQATWKQRAYNVG